jgi:ketosteroid isomerase-like protein
MNEKENTALVQQAYALFGRGDIAGVLKLLSPDVVWQLTKVENVPFTGRFEGPEGVGRFFANLAAAVDIVKFEPHEFLAQGDKVVVLGESLFKRKEYGNEFGSKWAHVITVVDGQLKQFDDYGDTATLAEAFKDTRR